MQWVFCLVTYLVKPASVLGSQLATPQFNCIWIISQQILLKYYVLYVYGLVR